MFTCSFIYSHKTGVFKLQTIYRKALENNAKLGFRGGKEESIGKARIVVVGCGGAGNNTVTRLSHIGIKGAELIAINTDKQHLEVTKAHKKVLIGYDITRGLGAGGYPEIGEQAALEAKPTLKEILEGADLVFVAAGMGGGTGSGSAPIVAEIAKEMGALVIGAVTMPFKLERARIQKAREYLGKLRKHADSVVVVDNNKLLEYVPDLPIEQAFGVADEILARMVKGITETIHIPSLINLDFADIKAVMSTNKDGIAMIGLGESDTKNRAEEAVMQALENPLLDVDYRGACGALIHITGGEDLTLQEANTVGEIATQYLKDDATVIWGARVDPEYNGRIEVMVIMTGVHSPDILGPSDIQIPRRLERRSYGYSYRHAHGYSRATLPRARGIVARRNTSEKPKEDIIKDLGIDYIT